MSLFLAVEDTFRECRNPLLQRITWSLILLLLSLATVAQANQTVFTTQTPARPDVSDPQNSYELGMKFQSAAAGYIKAIRYYKSPSETGVHQGQIWTSAGMSLATVTFANETASGWQEQLLDTPLNIQPSTTYVVSVNAHANYAFTKSGLATSIVNGDLSSVADGNNGIFGTPGIFPTSSWQDSNYFRDILFASGPIIFGVSGDNQTGEAGSTLPDPLVIEVRDANGNPQPATTVDFTVTSGGGLVSPISAVTDANGQAFTTLTLGSVAGANTVDITAAGVGTITFSATATPPPAPPTQIALTPAGAGTNLFNPVNYQATIQDQFGNPVTSATDPVTFSTTGVTGTFSPSATVTPANGVASVTFTPTTTGTATLTASATGLTDGTASLTVSAIPDQTVFTGELPAASDASDNGSSYEMGMKFQSAAAGYIKTIRYYKSPSEIGTHQGRIWTSAGLLLATVTFANETASGWQEQALDTPINIQANTTYVVSVNANSNFAFTKSGLATPIINGDLSSVADGNNGVFGTPAVFPTGSWQNSNYFRDIVFFAGPMMTKVSGDNQTGDVGAPLTQPMVVEVRDANGGPLAGTAVDFAVTSGGGSIAPATAVTDANGQAFATLTLGATTGLNTVSATAGMIGTLEFSATAQLSATQLSLSPQTTSTSVYDSVTYQATVLDSLGNTVIYATNPVSFTSTGVSGAFDPGVIVTPINGIATVNFTPTTTGTASITASANGLTADTANLTVSPQANQTILTSETPANPNASDGGADYEMGMKFQAARAGNITAIRYWKASSDIGPHTGHIWADTGGLPLATVTFLNETGSGWQEQTLTTPLPIQPAKTYIVSVNANGNYAVSNSGLASSIVNGDLSSVADGNNGLFGPPGAFPTGSYLSSNYFRDLVFVAGPTLFKLSGDNQNAPVNSTLAQPFVVEVRNIDGTPSAGTTVDFTVTAGGGTLSSASAVTDASGLASTTLTLGTTAGLNSVRATAGAFGSVDFTATADVPADSGTTLSLSATDSSTVVNTAVIYNASVLDVFGNLVTTAANPVSFTVTGVTGALSPAATVTPVNGVASVSFTPSATGLATISVTATGLTGDNAGLTVIDPVISIVSGDNQSGTVGSALSAPLVIEVIDISTGNPMAGTTVSFAVTTGGGSVLPASMVTDAAGRASTNLTLGSATGTNRVTATTQLAGSVVFTATANPGLPVALSLASSSANALVNTTLAYEASVLDEFGNVVTNCTNGVSFSVSGVSGAFNPASPVMPTAGVASTDFTPSSVGSATITASATGLSSASAPLTVTFGAIAKVSGDNQSAVPNTTLPQPLVVEVRDDGAIPVAGIPITFSVTGGGGSVAPASAVTDANGLASTSFTLGPLAGIHRVAVTAENVGSVGFTATTPNAITIENQKLGTTDWQITNPVTATTPEIEGYASATSVNLGATLPIKVSLAEPDQNYTIDVYRLGYYGGLGGRLITSVGPLIGNTQPPCLITDPATLLIECNWTTSYFLPVGTDWTSGLYVANLTESATGKQSQIWFVVRDDNSNSDILFQSSFTTFLAYNHYGSQERHSLYGFNSTLGQRAFKVSFDRPFGQVTTDPTRYDNMLDYEYPMARWLESQGYDVSYVTNMDVHADPNLLSRHETFMSVGHDEYWSQAIRDNVEQARDAGVNLAFFSANTAYWRVRFEPSGTGAPDRVMACYKDPAANDLIAPTYLWRGPENNRPENALLGVLYTGNDIFEQYGGYDHIVTNSTDPYYEFTGLNDGDALFGLVGFEWDAVVQNGFTPSGLVTLSQSIVDPLGGVAPGLPPGTDTTLSNAVRYTAASGAKVFANGSIQWMWGLDSTGVGGLGPRVDTRAQQFTVNLLRDMGARPSTPDPALIIP
ncbi:MAG: DUF4082 domain-containing protein [Pseudomonadota bacterium]